MDTNLLFNTLIQVDSTNNYATRQIREGLALHGNAWFTPHQTQGKGQRGKHWESEANKNLAISIVIQPPQCFNNSPFVFNMFVAHACAVFLEELVQQKIHIKWPNDLFMNDRKAGGLLIENTFRGQQWNWSTIGIGINLNQTEFSSSAGHPISLNQVTGLLYDPEEIARKLHKHLFSNINIIGETDLNTIQQSYNSRLYQRDRLVQLRKDNEVFQCTIKEVDASGQLIVDDGTKKYIQHGAVEWMI